MRDPWTWEWRPQTQSGYPPTLYGPGILLESPLTGPPSFREDMK